MQGSYTNGAEAHKEAAAAVDGNELVSRWCPPWLVLDAWLLLSKCHVLVCMGVFCRGRGENNLCVIVLKVP